MPDAASDVKAQIEEDCEEPWREVQNGEKDLAEPVSLAEESNKLFNRGDHIWCKCR
jgi:hypothetical protein